MLRKKATCLLGALLFLIGSSASPEEVLDDFSGGGWQCSNPKAPGKLTVVKGRLTLQDLPGGKVTWGTSAAKVFRGVDLHATPYIIFDVAKVGGRFAVKLSAGKERPKKTVCQATKPGPVVVDILRSTGWKPGKCKLVVMVYTHPDGTAMELSRVRITGKLTQKEAELLKKTPKAIVPTILQSGLKALASRRGRKPIATAPEDGERTIYIDPATKHRVWRMTDSPSIDRHIYYDILAWNADGSVLLFLSRRAGGTLWLMNADGSHIRPFPSLPDGTVPRSPHWSSSNPDLLYFARSEEKTTRVMSFNVETRKVEEVASVPFGQRIGDRTFSELPPPHPDEGYFLFRWGGQDHSPTLLVVADAKTGKYWKMEPGLPTHRVRFTKKADHSVFINCNWDPAKPDQKVRTEWVVNLDGTKRRLPSAGGHPDWSPDGAWLAAYNDGGIVLISYDGKVRKMLAKTMAGGHGGFSITTGKYHVGDSPKSGPYADLVYVTETATGRITPIAHHGSSYRGWGSGAPDPEATHPAPICSPDETKIVYDSDMLGQPDVWVAVWKLPGPPQQVAFSEGTLRWAPPALHREIAGYHVFRKENGHWNQVGPMVTGTRLPGLPSGQYAVASLERSGLESKYAMAGSDALTRDSVAPDAPGAPRIVAVHFADIVLGWKKSEEADFDHFNVYASKEPEVAPSLATLVGSPAVPRFVDWGLSPGLTYHYRITSVDRQGNESLPSFAASARTEGVAGPTVRLVLEAEKGHCDPPMKIEKSSEASGGAFVHVPDETSDAPYVLEGKLTLHFELPNDGVFDFWARAMGLDGQSNSFFLSLDGSPQANWGVPVPRKGKPEFGWSRMAGLEGAPLRKGHHVIVISSREDGTRLDKIIITNDPAAKITD